MPESGAEQIVPVETPEQKVSRLEAKVAELETRLKIAEANAATDTLTGLPNRRVLEMELEKKLALVRREGGRAAIAMFDLDNFKAVNDKYGHQQGDETLKGFAQRALDHTRGTDSLGRWGGEEFLAVFSVPEEMSLEMVESHILGRYHEMLKDLNRTGNENEFIQQTVSVGCVVVDQEDTSSIGDVIVAADIELYHSKTSGKNQSTIARLKDAVVPQVS